MSESDYDGREKRMARLESENAALKKMIGEWAEEITCAQRETTGEYIYRMGMLKLKMREATK